MHRSPRRSLLKPAQARKTRRLRLCTGSAEMPPPALLARLSAAPSSPHTTPHRPPPPPTASSRLGCPRRCLPACPSSCPLSASQTPHVEISPNMQRETPDGLVHCAGVASLACHNTHSEVSARLMPHNPPEYLDNIRILACLLACQNCITFCTVSALDIASSRAPIKHRLDHAHPAKNIKVPWRSPAFGRRVCAQKGAILCPMFGTLLRPL